MNNKIMQYKKERLTSPVLKDRYNKISTYKNEGIEAFSMLDSKFKTNKVHHFDASMIGCRVSVAGRIRMLRNGGKIAFIKIDTGEDYSSFNNTIDNFLQAVGKEQLTPEFKIFRKLHLGDIISASGIVQETESGEISLFVDDWQFLSKNIRPLPDKYHGMNDIEEKYRQRYADMIVTPSIRKTLIIRSEALRVIREVLNNEEFIEVETPVLQHTKGGASATAFETHYNSLNENVILRIAPELYLKKLVVGGLNRIYEIGKNFRNEGIDRTHSPEFTSLEFYAAYEDYNYMIYLCTEILLACNKVAGNENSINWNGHKICLSDIRTVKMLDLISEVMSVERSLLEDESLAESYMEREHPEVKCNNWGECMLFLFEQFCESSLINPTFVMEYPASVSPLARPSDQDPRFVDRFELFIGGVEVANGFNELANPEIQYERFADQISAKESGNDEAMDMDTDYINALEYGLPPTAGCGIGIDRIVMIITQNNSIKDTISFPHLKCKN